ncbi:rhodopsin-like [Paramacrobiotus metropolitanus]|uniref:rhodopsin-like n=1 Tax=Paramacrobiotus metropolitanus TaxID=2943436 RepID=UPI0024456AB1|nr:rhodopsin-like [Paramacrobiotus metropolitanus]
MNRNNSTTSTAFVAASVPAIGICRIFILITSFILNSIVFTVYVTQSKIRTPFSVYIISLVVSNILDVILFFPFMIANNLGTSDNHFIFGEPGCVVYGYGIAIIRSCCLCSHALITLNRIWAMTFPISYKNIHGFRFAICVCIFVLIAVHSVMVPGVILNEKFRPRPVKTYGCWYQVHAESTISSIGIVLFYIFPLIILSSYPYLFFKYLQTKKRIMAQDARTGVLSENKASRTFGIVTLLSFCTIVCWLPEELVTFLMMATWSKGSVRAYPIVSLLSSFQVLLDPLFLLISSKDLRYGLLSMVCGRKYMQEEVATLNLVTFAARSNTRNYTIQSHA